jgi:hypothetical protein
MGQMPGGPVPEPGPRDGFRRAVSGNLPAMASSRQLEAAKLNVRAARRGRGTVSAGGQGGKDVRREPNARDLAGRRRPHR